MNISINISSEHFWGTVWIETCIRYTIYTDNSAQLKIYPKISEDILRGAYNLKFDNIIIYNPDMVELIATLDKSNILCNFKHI